MSGFDSEWLRITIDKSSVVQGEGILFLFTDTQIVDEKMLVYVNDLLASGEIPDLFAQEDKDEIINALRSETKSMGLTDSAENCYMVFLQKVYPPTSCPGLQAVRSMHGTLYCSGMLFLWSLILMLILHQILLLRYS